ncbi:MAG: hypothetical protein V3T55_09745 [Anaerolineales bacterium]
MMRVGNTVEVRPAKGLDTQIRVLMGAIGCPGVAESTRVPPLWGFTMIFDQSVRDAARSPNGENIFFFSDDGLYVAYNSEYIPVLIDSGFHPREFELVFE